MAISRRDIMRLTAPAAMATTLLPVAGRWRAWSHPVGSGPATRPLGRTGREVTTFGLAGGNKVMWDAEGKEAVEIIVTAIRSGITYLETANNYQLSQVNYGKAFRVLNLVPGVPGYDAALRARLFLATKSHCRSAIVRGDAKPFNKGTSGLALVVDELHRSLTQFFGDGKGFIPQGAYIDLFQIHSLRSELDVDAAFEGRDNPGDPSLPRVGALAALVDYRDGSNLTGLNPGQKKYIRHIGISGHENPTAHMHAMRRDTRNELDAILVSINPNDRHYFSHATNTIPVAAARNMGIIGMKVFADGAMYGLSKTFASRPGQSVATIGQPGKLPPEDLLRYTLSTAGMSTLVTGIGSLEQLKYNLAACQKIERLPEASLREIERKCDALHGTDNNFFQRPAAGLVAPQGVRAERVPGKNAVAVSWSTAYAGAAPIIRYEIYRRHERIGSIAFEPQLTNEPLRYVDQAAPGNDPGGIYYKVRALDAEGRSADSLSTRVG